MLSDPINKYKNFFESYRKISHILNSTLDSKEIFGLFLENITKTLSVKAASLLLIDEKSKELKHKHSYGLSEVYLSKGPLELDKSILDLEEGKVTFIQDTSTDARVRYKEEAKKEGISSIIFFPLKVKNRIIGVLQLYTEKQCNFTDEEIDFASSLAELGSLALENSRLYEQRKENNKILWELAKSINSSLKLNETLENMAKSITFAMDLKGCVIRILDEKKKVLELMASYGLSEKYLKKGKVDLSRSSIEPIDGKPTYVYDATTDNRMQYPEEAKAEGIASILSVPMNVKGKMIGVLRLYTNRPREFDSDEMTFITTLADLCGIAIENSVMYQKLKDDFEDLRDNLWSYRSWF